MCPAQQAQVKRLGALGLALLSDMKRADREKENTPKRKQPRKSVGKRVSFGTVSMHEYEKIQNSPTPQQTAARRASLQAAGADARQAEIQARSAGTPPPPPPPEPEPAAGQQQPAQNAQAQAYPSPPVSEPMMYECCCRESTRCV